MKKIKLGIVGASGLVGQTILKVLQEENILEKLDLFLITSKKSENKTCKINEKEYKYMVLDEKSLDLSLDIVIFSSGDEISKLWAYKFENKGCYVIDNSNAFRRDNNVPLVVPEINGELINKNSKIIANPNCSTIQLAVVLYKLMQLSNIRKVIVSSYQSVSGAGKEAIDDLCKGTNNVFDIAIKDNIIAKIGDIEENDFCKEENKIMFEINKILKDDIKIYATTVRVPVAYCHGESVYVEFEDKIDKNNIKNALKCNFIKLSNKIYHNSICKNSNITYVFRVRQVSNNELLFFIMADNLRRGAAYNAVLILKKVIELIEHN